MENLKGFWASASERTGFVWQRRQNININIGHTSYIGTLCCSSSFFTSAMHPRRLPSIWFSCRKTDNTRRVEDHLRLVLAQDGGFLMQFLSKVPSLGAMGQ